MSAAGNQAARWLQGYYELYGSDPTSFPPELGGDPYAVASYELLSGIWYKPAVNGTEYEVRMMAGFVSSVCDANPAYDDQIWTWVASRPAPGGGGKVLNANCRTTNGMAGGIIGGAIGGAMGRAWGTLSGGSVGALVSGGVTAGVAAPAGAVVGGVIGGTLGSAFFGWVGSEIGSAVEDAIKKKKKG